jgi:hypothetical protein
MESDVTATSITTGFLTPALWLFATSCTGVLSRLLLELSLPSLDPAIMLLMLRCVRWSRGKSALCEFV